MLHSRTIAAELRGDVRPTTGLCEVGVRRMKVLREKAQCRSSYFELYLYGYPYRLQVQPALSWRMEVVLGLSVRSTPATR